MKEFEVTIKETLEKTITVVAEDQKEALKQAEQFWKNGDVILDSDSFTGVDFDCDEGTRIPEPIDVLVVEPGKYPHMETLQPGLEALQNAVGGNIESLYCFNEPVALICNEEGKINGLDLNRAIKNDEGELVDIIAGTFIVCGLGEDDFASLPKELQNKFEEKFHNPEVFLRLGKKLLAIPTEPMKPAQMKEKNSHENHEL